MHPFKCLQWEEDIKCNDDDGEFCAIMFLFLHAFLEVLVTFSSSYMFKTGC